MAKASTSGSKGGAGASKSGGSKGSPGGAKSGKK